MTVSWLIKKSQVLSKVPEHHVLLKAGLDFRSMVNENGDAKTAEAIVTSRYALPPGLLRTQVGL